MVYRSILVPVDNSRDSYLAEEAAVRLAQQCQGHLTGLHVNSGRFHQQRFSLLEQFLPEQYQTKAVLEHQRNIHSVLISRGLEIISVEYMKQLQDHCRRRGIPFVERIIDGKNASTIIEESGKHDLVIIGSHGLGEVKDQVWLGSNCRRLLRHGTSDIFIARKSCDFTSFTVGIDGSTYATKVLEKIIPLAKLFSAEVRIVASYDPVFHQQAFASLANVLSAQAGSVFRFNEQQQLHTSVIDSSLEGLYRSFLQNAKQYASLHGIECSVELLAGKPYCALCRDVQKHRPSLVVVGRFGLHRGAFETIGSNAEAVAELAEANVLVVAVNEPSHPLVSVGVSQMQKSTSTITWDPEAQQRLERIPSFARPMAMLAIERYAKERGIKVITPVVMKEAREMSA